MEIEFIEIRDGEIRVELAGDKSILLDEADLPKLGKQKWYMSTKGYLFRTRSIGGRYRHESMSRLIMDAPKGVQVDHINGNPLDNRRCNLRLCTQSQNMGNSTTYRSLKGVYKRKYKDREYWIAVCHQNYLGIFTDPIEAARAYDQAAIAKWGEFALTNERMGKI